MMPLMFINIVFTVILHLAHGQINWNGNNWAFNCDWLGKDTKNSIVPGDKCGGLCAQTSGCTHFTWTTYNGGTCWMKNGTVTKADALSTNDNTMVCGLLVDINDHIINWNGNNWAYSCDWVGKDLTNAKVTSDKCSGLCAKTTGCTHFTWTTFNNGTCWMKSGAVNKTDAFDNKDPSAVCGFITDSSTSGTSVNSGNVEEYYGSNWMSQHLSKIGSYKLRNLCMPGSHDAGMDRNVFGTIAPPCAVITQRKGIYDQLMNGVRFFDIRLIIGSGKYHTGHYSKTTVGWLGGRGQSMSEIIDQINIFTKTNKELIVLYVSHDTNTDTEYKSFTQTEWNGFFNQMLGLNYRFSISSTSDLTSYTLNDFIGKGEACVLVVIKPNNPISLGDYAEKGFFLDSSFPIYDDYSKTNDVNKMMSEQIEKMNSQRTSIDSQMFLLSWTLTQTTTQAMFCFTDPTGETRSILDLADIANSMTSFIFKQTTSDSYPNVILVDDAARASLLGICKLIHTRLATPPDVIFISG